MALRLIYQMCTKLLGWIVLRPLWVPRSVTRRLISAFERARRTS